MNIPDLNNTLNFGSIYKYNVERNNYDKAAEATEILLDLELENIENHVFCDFINYKKASQTGVFEKIHIAVNDDYDKYIESVLKQRNIRYIKQTNDQALKPENIYERIVLPKYTGQNILASLDTKKINELFRKNINFYISENNFLSPADELFQRFRNYLATGRDIEASRIVLSERNEKPNLNFIDGRHRYCVMRDLGLEKIKFAMNEDSLKLAYKYGLVVEK